MSTPPATSRPTRVLLADDDPVVATLLAPALRASGYRVHVVTDAAGLLDAHAAAPADLVLLDLGLPDLDGLAVLTRLRLASDVPVVVLTARGADADRVAGLDLGADDYVVKPTSPPVVAARVRAVLRRAGGRSATPTGTPVPGGAAGVLTAGALEVLDDGHVVRVGGVELDLAPRERELLAHLVRRGGRTCSRAELLREVWRSGAHVQTPATVTEHVGRLRRRLADHPDAPRIVTVRGTGYRLEA